MIPEGIEGVTACSNARLSIESTFHVRLDETDAPCDKYRDPWQLYLRRSCCGGARSRSAEADLHGHNHRQHMRERGPFADAYGAG